MPQPQWPMRDQDYRFHDEVAKRLAEGHLEDQQGCHPTRVGSLRKLRSERNRIVMEQ